jgi:hypothetical protein
MNDRPHPNDHVGANMNSAAGVSLQQHARGDRGRWIKRYFAGNPRLAIVHRM